MSIPDFDPYKQCIDIVTLEDGVQFKVIIEASKEKRQELNMKVAEYVNDHFNDIKTEGKGFKNLIRSIGDKFTKGKFSKNPDFVVKALKGSDIDPFLMVGNLRDNKLVMLAALKKNLHSFRCDPKLLQDDDFLIECLKVNPEALVIIIDKRFKKGDAKTDAEYIMKNLCKDLDKKSVEKGIENLKVLGKRFMIVEIGQRLTDMGEELQKQLDAREKLRAEKHEKLKLNPDVKFKFE